MIDNVTDESVNANKIRENNNYSVSLFIKCNLHTLSPFIKSDFGIDAHLRKCTKLFVKCNRQNINYRNFSSFLKFRTAPILKKKILLKFTYK